MNTQESTAKRKRRSNSKGPLFLIFFIILCTAAIGLAWLYKQGSGTSHDITNSQSDNNNQSISLTNSTNDNREPSLPTVEAIEKHQQQEEQIKPPDNTIIESDLSSSLSTTSDIPASITRTIDEKTTDVEEQLSAPHTLSQRDQCQQSAQFVRDFFNHLDDQKYIQDFLGDQASEPYFISLIQKLVNNPPVVSRETDDLFTILKNTAHFFRIIGSDNIFILKVILHEEKPQVENVLARFYTMSLQEDCAKQQFGLDLPKEALYDYAGFFFIPWEEGFISSDVTLHQD